MCNVRMRFLCVYSCLLGHKLLIPQPLCSFLGEMAPTAFQSKISGIVDEVSQLSAGPQYKTKVLRLPLDAIGAHGYQSPRKGKNVPILYAYVPTPRGWFSRPPVSTGADVSVTLRQLDETPETRRLLCQGLSVAPYETSNYNLYNSWDVCKFHVCTLYCHPSGVFVVVVIPTNKCHVCIRTCPLSCRLVPFDTLWEQIMLMCN